MTAADAVKRHRADRLDEPAIAPTRDLEQEIRGCEITVAPVVDPDLGQYLGRGDEGLDRRRPEEDLRFVFGVDFRRPREDERLAKGVSKRGDYSIALRADTICMLQS